MRIHVFARTKFMHHFTLYNVAVHVSLPKFSATPWIQNPTRFLPTGFFRFSGSPGEMPKVAISGGSLPSVNASSGSIAIGTKTEKVAVPDVKVDTKTTSVEMPSIAVKKAE